MFLPNVTGNSTAAGTGTVDAIAWTPRPVPVPAAILVLISEVGRAGADIPVPAGTGISRKIRFTKISSAGPSKEEARKC